MYILILSIPPACILCILCKLIARRQVYFNSPIPCAQGQTAIEYHKATRKNTRKIQYTRLWGDSDDETNLKSEKTLLILKDTTIKKACFFHSLRW